MNCNWLRRTNSVAIGRWFQRRIDGFITPTAWIAVDGWREERKVREGTKEEEGDWDWKIRGGKREKEGGERKRGEGRRRRPQSPLTVDSKSGLMFLDSRASGRLWT